MASKRLHGFVVAHKSTLNGHARGSVDAKVRFVEGEEGVGAVVGDRIGGGRDPVRSQGGIIVEEQGDEAKWVA